MSARRGNHHTLTVVEATVCATCGEKCHADNINVYPDLYENGDILLFQCKNPCCNARAKQWFYCMLCHKRNYGSTARVRNHGGGTKHKQAMEARRKLEQPKMKTKVATEITQDRERLEIQTDQPIMQLETTEEGLQVLATTAAVFMHEEEEEEEDDAGGQGQRGQQPEELPDLDMTGN